VSRYGIELVPRLRGDGRREDQLRAPVYSLLREFGLILGRGVVVHDEVTLADLSSRPDFAVDTPGGRIGYIELKALEKGIPGRSWRPTKHDREQFVKLSRLPNLIYTNGQCFGLYRKGVLVGQVAEVRGDLATAGHRLAPADDELGRLFREFLVWKPDRPTTLRWVVREVAPLCRLLRDQVADMMAYEQVVPGRRPFTVLADEWRSILFPTLGETEFADAYAQAVTFALLLARVDGIAFEGRPLSDIATQLAKQHSLMGAALSILANPKWVAYLSVVDTLVRVIENVDWDRVRLEEAETWSLLYETFLAEYDPVLRRRSGTYYTPDLVARAMVGFADQVLKVRLGKARGFASDDVVVVDPAMGTGTFLVEIISQAVATLRNERGSQVVPKAHVRELFEKRLVGFERQVAPYAVAELRLHHTLRQCKVELPRDEVRFLSNAFDDPDKVAMGFGQLYEELQASRDGANRIKREQPVMVVIGNPPWRERARGEATWLERPRTERFQATEFRDRPSLDEFRAPGQERRAFNLSNMWTFFWRWATWKAFDANPKDPSGIVILITPKAYLSSESHAGMRRYLRETADEGWIIDLSPEEFQAKVASRIFPGVQQPICIGVFARYGDARKARPARVHHIALHGRRQEKIDQVAALTLDGPEWLDATTGWLEPFQPSVDRWMSYPRLSDLFPWQQTGVNSNRNWVWAPDSETLQRRWHALIHAPQSVKGTWFKVTRDRSLTQAIPSVPGVPSGATPLNEEHQDNPPVARIAYRSFDRQFVIHDGRVLDFSRPELWRVLGGQQIYTSEQHSVPVTKGIALTFAALVPNVNHFNGRGGRVIPLYRDPQGLEPNISIGLLPVMRSLLGSETSAEDLLSYVAAVVAHSGYTCRFRDELATPGVRIPLTMDLALWNEAVSLGHEVLWLHTYGERCVDEAAGRPHTAPRMPEGRRPWHSEPIPVSGECTPDTWEYCATTQTLIIGRDSPLCRAGRVEGVTPEMWEYNVGGGVPVIRRWLSYRQSNPRRKKHTSPLDAINPPHWTAQFDDELLDLLNVIGCCLDLEPHQAGLLDRICLGPLVTVSDLEREGVFPVHGSLRRPPRQPLPASPKLLFGETT
jgi:hypothetical protein